MIIKYANKSDMLWLIYNELLDSKRDYELITEVYKLVFGLDCEYYQHNFWKVEVDNRCRLQLEEVNK